MSLIPASTVVTGNYSMRRNDMKWRLRKARCGMYTFMRYHYCMGEFAMDLVG